MNSEYIISELKALTEHIGATYFDRTDGRYEKLELKARNQLVTDLDIQVEKDLVTGLKKIVPEAGFLTEEKTVEQQKHGGLKWIIDPIDGTTNFVHNVPAFAISIGLEDSDGMVAGVIFELNRKEFFSAYRGNGAFLNGLPISVSDAKVLEDTLIATGFPYYDYTYTPEYLKVLEVFIRRTRGVRRLGSAAIDLAYVACGRFDAFYEYSLSPWDVAAGKLLVEEAGGIVCDFKGGSDSIYGKSIIATQPNIQNDVTAIIRKYFG